MSGGPTSPPPGADVPSPEAYIQALVADAQLIAGYQSHSGQLADGALHDAIAKVEALPIKSISSPDVVALQKAFSKAMEIVPFSILLELRRGWRPGQDASAGGRLGILVVLSVILMIVIGNLTQTYNRGIILLSEIKTLSSVEPTRRYGELIRQLIEARARIATETVSASNDEQKLRLVAYFQTFDELRSLDTKLSSLGIRVRDFQESTRYPIVGAWTILYATYLVQEKLGIESEDGASFLRAARRTSLPQQPLSVKDLQDPSKAPEQPISPNATLLELTCPSLKKDDEYAAAQTQYIEGRIGGPKEFAKIAEQYIYEMSYLRCFQSFQSNPNYLPDLETWIRGINDNIAPYNLWVLPSLFGAIGGIIFYLRMIVNPLLPNPSWFRIIHRVAFGALAGMALAWFWVPEVRFGVEIPNVGFGLFAMAFIVGFSLDVFFTMLDRLVALANTAVGNIGASRTGGG